VQAYLWTGKPAPWKYIRLQLCRDVYHCDPVTFKKIPMVDILEDLEMLDAEAKVNKLISKKK
jgi:hypothetical protein